MLPTLLKRSAAGEIVQAVGPIEESQCCQAHGVEAILALYRLYSWLNVLLEMTRSRCYSHLAYSMHVAILYNFSE